MDAEEDVYLEWREDYLLIADDPRIGFVTRCRGLKRGFVNR
jgi:hypothetical protein